jgi:hypothetical protein
MNEGLKPSRQQQTSELLILANGNIFVHNLTPEMAGLLAELDPDDKVMRQRAESSILINDTQIDNRSSSS